MPGMDGFDLIARMRQNPLTHEAIVMMLTSSGQRGDAARCKQLGIDAYLVKPVRKSELLSAILSALGERRHDGERVLITRQTMRQSSRPLRILAAEDNAVNQALIRRILEKLGHTPVLAANGREALDYASTESFDAVLMDVQMPEMDGFTATAKIRENEKNTGAHGPIIAMTANAMKGDREKCLAAGMDEYLSKPVSSKQVQELLDRMFGGEQESAPPSRPLVWQRSAMLERMDEDENLLNEVLGIFLDDYPKSLAQLEAAVSGHKADVLERVAHSLKGELGYLAVPEVSELARRLQEMGRVRNFNGARELLTELERQLNQLAVLIRKTLGGKSAAAGS
jgi:CheY-like chemotaxis protein/HPt (histidine-containing phosphotransfer) domain-containing protein